jgi:hypothetical protein
MRYVARRERRRHVSASTVVAAALAIVLAGGCRIQPPGEPVPVERARDQRDSLDGEWEGTYRASGAARHGVLRFSLRPGADTAYGEVEITFAGSLQLYGDPPDEPLPRSPCRVLQIAFVRLDAGTISGTLAPYWDPDCECQTLAVFEGRLSAPDGVEGTFTSRRAPDGPALLSGRWVAKRR